MSYKRKAVVGFGWQIGGLLSQQLVQLLIRIVFARILLKEEFGQVAVAMAIMDYATLLRVAGVTQAFISHRGSDEEERHTVFWGFVGSGLLFTLLIFIAAPTASDLLNSPALAQILRVLAVIQFLDSLRLLPFALASRQLRFPQIAVAEGIPGFVGLAVALGALPFLARGDAIWALVLMYVARSASQAVLFYVIQPYKPAFRFDYSFYKGIARRGWSILASNIPSSILDPLPLLFVAARSGKGAAVAAGIFSLALVATAPVDKIGRAAHSTLFPILAKLAGEPEKLRSTVKRSFKSLTAVCAGLLGWLFAAAPELIPLVFGNKWEPAVAVTRVLTIAVLLRILTFTATNVFIAIGNTKPASITWFTTLAVALVALSLPVYGTDGALAAAWLVCGYSLVGFAASLMFIPAEAGSAAGVLESLVPGVAAAIAGIAAAFAAKFVMPAPNQVALLVVGSAAYGIVFAALAGKLLGGTWTSFFTYRGLRDVVKMN